MFNPEEIIFSVTTLCNKKCPHCFIDRTPAALKSDEAINFLKSIKASNHSTIEKVGFSGGEPFLAPDFLTKVIKECLDLDFMFDRIMTNGDWWNNKDELKSNLQKIYDSGYDGKIGLSYDSFHAQDENRIVTFIKTVWEIFGNDSLEIQSVGQSENMLRSLADKLQLEYTEELSASGRGIALLKDEEHFLFANIQTESFQSTDSRAFKDKNWFKDDFCEGPGQVLFVHATGDIAPCCGFANENKALFIGKITDTFDEVMQKSYKNELVNICYKEGLSKQIKLLQNEGLSIPGKTEDICTFCDFLCRLKK